MKAVRVKYGRRVQETEVQKDPFADLAIPMALQESLDRHRKHLAELVMNLRSAGLDEAQIEGSVSMIVESYRQELMRAMKAMAR